MSHSPAVTEADLAAEQRYVSMLYGRLDALRELSSQRLSRSLAGTGSTPQERSERDSAVAMYTQQLAQYSAVESGLCFGRLDRSDGEQKYIGRIGLFDYDNDYRPLLMDWRAPASRPFYLATAAAPDGVRSRRHIRTRSRLVTDIDDEVLDIDVARPGEGEGLAGEAALLAAVTAARTGRMADIVATIQAEQDRIIRAQLGGVLVVQGGPGTGKTAVALHRAAYLLYTHRDQLARRGVLVVGPNETFLRYIGQVLPSLGETGVLLSTIGELFPGVTAQGREPAAVTEIKGRAVMADVLRAAVHDRQRVPRQPIEIAFENEPLVITPAAVRAARTKARRSRRPHNRARPVFRRELITTLTGQVAERMGRELLDPADLRDIAGELRESAELARVLDELWPDVSPQRLVAELLSGADRLAAATKRLLPAADRELLLRDRGGDWTPADVPLLDEAAELLGEDDTEAKAAEAYRRQAELDYAQGVLDLLDLPDHADPELLLAPDILSAQTLAERYADRECRTAAERAADDRTWTFGHVIVDEAQELSPMAWRVIMRRCPSRSMTLVGDPAQTGALGGVEGWGEVLRPYVGDRWRCEELTVNYRTPAEIMAVAARLAADHGLATTAPRSVRESGRQPWAARVAPGALAACCAEAVRAELASADEGTVAVLAPDARCAQIAAAVARVAPDVAAGTGADTEARVSVLPVMQAKGLEFDAVVLAEPAELLAESPRGVNNLYVALTRATQRLGVLHTGELPEALGGLADRS